MSPRDLSRRQFIAVTSATLLASQLPAEGVDLKSDDATKLAIEGGSKSLKNPSQKLIRWGEPERERLLSLLSQSTLLYWKAPQTTLLIQRFREHYPLKHVMTCSSGTAAVHVAIAAAGIGPGDEVITTPITDMGTVIGILFQQAVPVFADLNPHDYNLEIADVERKITSRTKAIIAVHLAGNPSKLNQLKQVADQHGLILIEDCAQAWGAAYQGKPVGTIGHIACWSLQDSKQITCGEGGIVASNDERFGQRLQPFADKGIDRNNVKQATEILATNYRMSELQAAFAAAQMTRMQGIAAQRAKLGNLLTREIQGLPGITAHQVDERDRCSYYSYILRIQPKFIHCGREQFVKALNAEGIAASAGYIPEPLYKKPLFQNHSFFAGRWPIREMGLTKMDYTKISCPEAEAILETCVLIRINQAMDEDYIRGIGAGIRKVTRHFTA
ncbi:DegT/DnrJ/EryC1/StrS family aminotransferase [Pedosphaera parvula]|uniref:Glutamine--scyllo-inositol transaminase n=1 Tax=Pedosphaera parvula (strain Ellin514) TaxID=320771 RepID=B9XNC9_PEDPL|nr:DegT/DnrJ/EryC1/StrS aminotransferase family protein [Pedosphaera parvula]EEF58682.1 Glutamine--scyllo-inositol transaminase [Pedosphaera parvula Ellin514]